VAAGESAQYRLKLLLCAYSALSVGVSWIGCRTDWQSGGWAAVSDAVAGIAGLGLCLLVVGGAIARLLWAGESNPQVLSRRAERRGQFRAPLAPLTPLLGLLCNFGLVMQLSRQGLLLVVFYFAVASACYFAYSVLARSTPLYAVIAEASGRGGEDDGLPVGAPSPEVELAEGRGYHRLAVEEMVASPHSVAV